MSPPKLEITADDVKAAIGQAFKRDFANLTFTKNEQFDSVDSSFSPCFTLQEEFSTIGEYPILGTVKLLKKGLSTLYQIKGTVKVDSENDSPKIEFNQPLNVYAKYGQK